MPSCVLQPPTDFSTNPYFQSLTCFHWEEWGHYAIVHDLGQKMTTSNVWYYTLIFRRSSEVTDRVWPVTYMQWMNWLFSVVVVFFWGGGPGTKFVAHFLHRNVFSAMYVQYATWSIAIGLVCSQAISYYGVVAPFRDGTRHKYRIKIP